MPRKARPTDIELKPIPGVEAILAFLTQRGLLMKAEHIAEEMDCKHAEGLEAMRARLEEMADQGLLLRNRRGGYGVAAKMGLIAGTIIGHPDGFGFVKRDEPGDDLYLSPAQMRQVLNGDRVLVSVIGIDRKGRSEGAIVSVLSRRSPRVVGRYLEERGFGVVAPDDRRIHQDLLVPKGAEGGAKPGDVVVAEITEPPTPHRQPLARIVRVLGEGSSSSLAVDMAIESHGLPHEWPAGLDKELKRIGSKVKPAQIEGRTDLRDVPLVTIDGEDARDFDDAVWCEPTRGGGYRLLVAIADVASYVQPGTLLDRSAYERGTSVYFPQRVIPMLPEVLSNGICSLKPDEERLCLVCEMRINKEGETTKSLFYPAVMRSHARLTYTQVWQALGERRADVRKRLGAVLPHLEHLYALFQVLAKARGQRGALDFEGQEVRFSFDEQGAIAGVRPYERNDAHRLIEEMMIAANVAAAKFLKRAKVPALYRVHARPPLQKFEELVAFLEEVGLRVPAYEDVTPLDLKLLLDRVRVRPDAALIEAVVLRSQSLAAYTPNCDGHFGLALGAYAHFTSPIRRYPDLLVHRAIYHALSGAKAAEYRESPAQMTEHGQHCSRTERRAEEASRDVSERLKCAFLERHVGDEFPGIVTGVMNFGLFVEIADTRITGLVHVTQLPNDYYHFDPRRHRLSGERTRTRFQLADKVKVRVLRVDPIERRIDFRLAGEYESSADRRADREDTRGGGHRHERGRGPRGERRGGRR